MSLCETGDGGRLWFEVAGDGPAVTFVHPGLWDARVWDREFLRFAEAGFRVLRYDVRGYGRSSRLDGSAYSDVRDLASVLEAAAVRSTALVGCSMGGGIAIDFTLEHPDRVWALALAASSLGGFEPTEAEEDWWEEATAPIEAAIETGDLERAQELRMGIWAPLGTDREPGATIRRIAFENLHELTMDESGAEELDPPAVHRLHEIDVPTLVLSADHDPPMMIRSCELIARGVLDARSLVVDDADHVINLRRPQAFERAVLPFLLEAHAGLETV
jgi:pimeloyl-ACP methyl ester carboxylesterase